MEFSRVIAIACFTAGKWLMIVTGVLFLALTAAQHLRSEDNAEPVLTVSIGLGCLVFAVFMHYLIGRVERMNKT